MMLKINEFHKKHLDISAMTEDDVNTIHNLEKICFSQPWSEKSLISSLKNKNSYFIVAKYNKNIVGYAGMYFVQDEGYIYNIAVYPEFRRLGIGQALLENLEIYCINNKLKFISLEVRESNTSAYFLYLKSNFKNIGKRKNFYTNPVEDAIIMTKFL